MINFHRYGAPTAWMNHHPGRRNVQVMPEDGRKETSALFDQFFQPVQLVQGIQRGDRIQVDSLDGLDYQVV